MISQIGASLQRLAAGKANKALRAIETMERNRETVATVAYMNATKAIPGVQHVSHNARTHCLTVKFIGLSVQFYTHLDKCLIQEGNAPRRMIDMTGPVLVKRLSEGRKSFMYV